jgi:hypothetical protein
MSYRIAGIDVHKKMLAVVIADIVGEGEYSYERRRFGATESELRRLAEWLIEFEVQEAVMESTAQYWRPVWATLEQHWRPRMQQREGAGPMAGSYIWCRPNPIVEHAAGRTIFETRNACCGGSWRRN